MSEDFSTYSLPAWIHVHLGSSCQQKILITASSEEEEFKFNQVFQDQILEKILITDAFKGIPQNAALNTFNTLNFEKTAYKSN